MNELYDKLETPHGERKIYRIAKANGFTKNNQIKDEQRVVLRDLYRIMVRWKGYFDKLLNSLFSRMECQMMVEGMRYR